MDGDKVDPPAVWAGVAHVDPAAVFVVGGEAASAAELARWVRYARMREVAGEPAMDPRTERWCDVGLCAVVLGALVCVVWVVRNG